MQTARALPHTAPQLRLLAMTDDIRRDTPTIEAPPPSEPLDTQPPDSAEDAKATRAMKTLLPQRQLSEPVKEMAIDQLLRMYADAQARERDLLDADGRLAKLNDERARRMKEQTVEELSDVVERIAGQPMRQLAEVVASISESLLRLKQDLEDKVIPKLDRHEQSIAEMRSDLVAAKAELTDLRAKVVEAVKRIDALEKRIPETKDTPMGTPPW